MIQDAIRAAVERKDLTVETAREVMLEMMRGDATPSQIASFITAMRMKGETEQELVGFVTAMRERSAKITVQDDCVDLCGTGGDGSNSFNISTAASFVTAASGVPVAKHGNRSISSRSGSADVLSALGVPIDLPPAQVEECIRSSGLGFMYAPLFHESMKNVSVPRRELGLRTFFNVLGPMTNPAGVKRQLIGVYDPRLAPLMASVLARLGTSRAMIVNGSGLDEMTTLGRTEVVELSEGRQRAYSLDPGMFDIDPAEPRDLRGGDAFENARIMLSVLKGGRSPRSDIVALNAGAAIYVSGRAASLPEGVEMAQATIQSGRALGSLKRFAEVSRSLEAERQRAMTPRELSTRKLIPEVLVSRAAEIANDLLLRIRGLDGQAYLGSIDDRLISEPNVLSVLVLNRIRSLLAGGDGHQSESHPRSKTTLSSSIRSSRGISIIAEYKPSSPGQPALMVPPDAEKTAHLLGASGVAGVSVLVEPDFFLGGTQLFAKFRSALDGPMLFKDFVVSEGQVETASRLGADAVLLIAKALTDDSLDRLVQAAVRKNLEPLVEVHDELDMSRLCALPSLDKIKLVGVNSRDLGTMTTDLSSLPRLRSLAPEGVVCIAESGIMRPSDLKSIRGFDAALVGSLFMRADNIAREVAQLVVAGVSM